MIHFAVSHGTTTEDATFLLSILGICNTAGRLGAGYVSDWESVDCVLLHNIALIIAGVITCLFPYVETYMLMCIYAGMFGLCIGEVNDLWLNAYGLYSLH